MTKDVGRIELLIEVADDCIGYANELLNQAPNMGRSKEESYRREAAAVEARAKELREWADELRAEQEEPREAAVTNLESLQALVNRQAEDHGLWFDAQTAPEAYLQQELRKLHAAIEALPAEPTEDARSIGHSMRQCLLRKEPIPEVLALAAIAHLDPPEDSAGPPWCDNCGEGEAAHTGPALKCPPENRRAE